MLEILEALSKQHDVTVYSTNPEQAGARGAFIRDNLKQKGVREIVAGHWNLGRVLSRSRFDLLFCEYWHVAEDMVTPFRRANPNSPVIVDSVDLHFVREEAGIKVGCATVESAAEIRRRELAVYRDADLVVNVTPEDDGILRSLLPSTPTVIVPIIVPTQPRLAADRGRLLFFVGNLAHQPNVDGIVWFGREIWPLIRQASPEARLEIGGRNPPAGVSLLGEIPGISLLGWVPDTAICLERAAISIAPLRFGGGMKGKVTEALAHGVPVVTTSFGAQGFSGRTGEHFHIADEPAEFAKAVITLLQNPGEAHEMGLRGQALVAQLCSPEAVGRVVAKIPLEATLKKPSTSTAARFRFQVGAVVELLGRRLARQGRTWMGLERPRE